jgi:signal peptidase I
VILYLLSALACLAGAAVIGARGLRRKIAVVTVRGVSMHPALHAGDRLLIRRARTDQLRAGQIVVIERSAREGRPASWPPAGQEWMIKRLAALPGDPTPAPMFSAAAHGAEPVVPAGKLVVLGDNAARSLDSRVLGYIAAERVLGIMIRTLPS